MLKHYFPRSMHAAVSQRCCDVLAEGDAAWVQDCRPALPSPVAASGALPSHHRGLQEKGNVRV